MAEHTIQQKLDAITAVADELLKDKPAGSVVDVKEFRARMKARFPDITLTAEDTRIITAELEKKHSEVNIEDAPVSQVMVMLKKIVRRFGKAEVQRLLDVFD